MDEETKIPENPGFAEIPNSNQNIGTEDLVVPTPKHHSVLKKAFIAGIVLLVILAGGFFLLKGKVSTFKQNPQPISKTATVSNDLSVNSKNALSQKETFVFANTAKAEDVSITDWPEDLRFLIFSNVQDIKLSKALDKNNKMNYVGTLTTQVDMSTTQRAFVSVITAQKSKVNWTYNYERSDYFGFLEAQNSKYQIRITQEPLNDKTSVKITVLVK